MSPTEEPLIVAVETLIFYVSIFRSSIICELHQSARSHVNKFFMKQKGCWESQRLGCSRSSPRSPR